MRCGDVPKTRLYWFALARYWHILILPFSTTPLIVLPPYKNLAFTELGRFNIFGFPKTGHIYTLSPLGHCSAWQNRTALTRMKTLGTSRYTNAPFKKCFYCIAATEEPRLYGDCVTIGNRFLCIVLPTCWQDASAVAYVLYPQSQDMLAPTYGIFITWHRVLSYMLLSNALGKVLSP